MIYLDTNIFVYAAINNGKLGEKCRKLLFEIVEHKIQAYTSIITWDEVVYAIWKKEGREKALAEGKIFLTLPNIKFLNTNRNTVAKAQEIIEKYNLKPRDAIHVASALTNNIKEIVSDDPDFDKVKEIKRKKLKK